MNVSGKANVPVTAGKQTNSILVKTDLEEDMLWWI